MKKIMLATLLTLTLFAFSARAQDAAPAAPAKSDNVLAGRAGYANIGIDGAYMFDPDMGMGMVSLDYYVTDEIAVGPYIYAGGGGQNSFWAVAGQVKFSPELVSVKSVRPYVSAGIGFINFDFDNNDGRYTTYLFPVGWGIEWGVSDIMSLEAGGMYEITENTFTGINVGLRILL